MHALLTVVPIVSSIVLNTLSPSALVPRKMLLAAKAEASVSAISNPGTLDPTYELDFVVSGVHQQWPNTNITASAGEGDKVRSGTTYAYLTNNTGSSVSITPSPYTIISVDILCALTAQTAKAKISLGGVKVPSDGSFLSSTGITPDYPDPTYISDNVYFSVDNLAPGHAVHAGDQTDGTFSLEAISP